jgi:hypothetical protein
VLYGINVTVFIDCIRVLHRKGIKNASAIYLFVTAIALFVFVTMHLIVDINRNMDAFTTHSTIENYADKYYAKFAAFQDIFKSAIYTVATLCADAFIVYRCFIVWGKNYLVIIAPILLFLADIAIGILWTFTVSQVPPGGNIFTDDLSSRIRAFYGITMSLNIVCTGLLSFKIWHIQSKLSRYSTRYNSHLLRVIPIIIESGAVYSVLLIILIILWATGNKAMFIFLNPTCTVIGIVFSSVITRIGSGVSYGDEHSDTTSRSRTLTGSHDKDLNGGVQIGLHRVIHIDRSYNDPKTDDPGYEV